ncbi:hypothetical protein Golob_013043 [Gossypium lobatum]|uniref:DUF4283 domain-containing protein n=1 Tax=Gossypium lobatum TaxID=34289 RepID=A0A7J8LN71_9ROSI|nr:hypothetical protein [Gossypium lobatum]
MENDLATLQITEEEDDVIQLLGPLIGHTSLYEFCFVGCFVTTSVIHFLDMNNTLANLWHPLEGIQITDLREKWFLFWFFNCVDFDRVIRGAHWTFNNHLLVFHCRRPSKDPLLVPLIYSYFWVQIHDLPRGLFSEAVARALGNFVGLFEEACRQFYPIHLVKEVIANDMGWDISLRAVARRAAVMDRGFHLVLALNLEGAVSRTIENVLGVYGLVNMIYDLKYANVVGIGGKKRLRSGRSSRLISEGSNSLRADVLVDLRSFSWFYIDVNVKEIGTYASWIFTGFYGLPDLRHWSVAWDRLRTLEHDQRLPWTLVYVGTLRPKTLETAWIGGCKFGMVGSFLDYLIMFVLSVLMCVLFGLRHGGFWKILAS